MAMFREDRIARYGFLAGAALGAGGSSAIAAGGVMGKLGYLAGASIASGGGGGGKAPEAASLLGPAPTALDMPSNQSRSGQLMQQGFQPTIATALSQTQPPIAARISEWNQEVGRAQAALEGIRRGTELGSIGAIATARDAARPTQIDDAWKGAPYLSRTEVTQEPRIEPNTEPLASYARAAPSRPANEENLGLIGRGDANLPEVGRPPVEEQKPSLLNRFLGGVIDTQAAVAGKRPPSIQSDRREDLTGFQKTALTVSDIVAAGHGQLPPSIKIAYQEQREDRLRQVAARRDLEVGHKTLRDISNEASKFPVGPERDAYFEAVQPMIKNSLGPEFLDLLDYMQENPGYLSSEAFEDMLARDPALEVIIALGGKEAAVDYLKQTSVAKQQLKADYRALYPSIRSKLQGAIPWVENNLPEDWRRINKDGLVSVGEYDEMRARLPERYRTTDAERDAFLDDPEQFNDLIATPKLIHAKRLAAEKSGAKGLTNEQLAKNEARKAARLRLSAYTPEEKEKLLKIGYSRADSLAAKNLFLAATPLYGEPAEVAIAELEKIGFGRKDAEIIVDEASQGWKVAETWKDMERFVRRAQKRIVSRAQEDAERIKKAAEKGGAAASKTGAAAAAGVSGIAKGAAEKAGAAATSLGREASAVGETMLETLEPLTRTPPPPFPKDAAARQEGATYSLGDGTIVRYNGPGKAMTRLMAP